MRGCRWLGLVLVMLLPSCSSGQAASGRQSPRPTGEPEGSILEVLEADGRFETFLSLLEIDTPFCCQGFVQPLHEATLTLFAPVDEAFDALSPGVLKGLIQDEQPMLRLLENHIVHGDVPADALSGGELEMVGGSVEVMTDAEGLTVGGAAIIDADIPASNGRIHAIDGVITRSCLQLTLTGEPECRDLVAEAT